MEVSAAATAEQTVTYITTGKSLAQQVKEYMEATNTKISTLANEIPGYSRPTISRYLSGKYEGDVSTVERLLADWLAKRKSEVVEVPDRPKRGMQRPRFYESRDAKAVLGVCQSCQEYREMGIITGRSGYGKTYTLKEYSKLPRVAYIECDVTMSPRDLLKELERALGIPARNGTNHDRTNGIVDFLTINPGYLLIVDEADKLMSKYTYSKMEILRSIFDRCSGNSDCSTCGLVIAGEPKLRVQIDTHLEQYANRTIFETKLRGLSELEVEEYLSDYEIEPDALAELKARATNERTGCFRLLERTMRNVWRILEGNKADVITSKVLKQASSMMMF